MLGKLLKYDLKWTYKVIVLFYILAIIFSVIGRTFIDIENSLVFNVLGQISIGIAISMMVSSLINCLMRSWVRLVRNVYKDESYLTHTLPIKNKTIYLSKVLSAIICLFTTLLVILLCIAICYYSEANIESLKSTLELAAETYDTTVIKLILIISVVLFLELAFILLIGYAGIIIGHRFNNNKMLKSIIISFALYMITQVITLAVIFGVGLFNSEVMNLINTSDAINIDAIKILMYVAMGIYIVYNVIYYLIGKMQLEKGVNID